MGSHDEENMDIGMKGPATVHTPLLRPPANYYEGCPGCMLDRRKASSQATFPLKELSLVALLSLSNALPVCSLFSYVYFMVRDLGIAKSVTNIGTYSGYLGSSLLLGRFVSSTPWGIVAGTYGHKPVILLGTTTIFLFNTLFGFSTNYWMALMSRFLLGVGNGMTGTITAYASEICRQEHQAVGMSVVGTMWGLGLIIGPAIGGYLAQPSEKLPALFPSGSLFDRFPYALCNVCISAFAAAGFVSSFFLPESIHKHGENGGSLIKRIYSGANNKAKLSLLEDHVEEVANLEMHHVKKSLWKNWGFVAIIIVISIWVVHATAYSEIFSLWAVSPELYGGLEFTTSEVADVLAVSGAAILIFQILVFPHIANALGAIQIVRLSAVLTTILTAIYPLFHKLQGNLLWAVLMLSCVVKNILSVSGFTGVYILTNNSVEKAQRGVANGVLASFMSAFQAVGPTVAGAIFSWSEERIDASFLPGMWMVFSLLGVLSFFTFLATLKPFLPSSLEKPISEE